MSEALLPAAPSCDVVFVDFLGQGVKVPSMVLYPGGDKEMVLGKLVRVEIGLRAGGKYVKSLVVIPVKRSVRDDGLYARNGDPVRLTNWHNIVLAPEWLQ